MGTCALMCVHECVGVCMCVYACVPVYVCAKLPVYINMRACTAEVMCVSSKRAGRAENEACPG